MSKIEKALRKARQDGSPSGRALVHTPQPAKAEYPPAATGPANLPVESTSAAEIALMHQPASLDVHQRLAKKIIYPEAAENATIKALREIRTRIAQKTANRNCVILVTGTSLGSGASFVAVNLAAAFALDAARTSLVVDCNIRDPFLHNLVSGEIKAGLTNYLTDSRRDISDVILPTGIKRLRVIPAGVNIDPTVEYFTMDRMKRLIRSVRERYSDRHIILDCPPLARSADTQILMEMCDYVLVVVPYARATPARLQAALKLIDSQKLLGVVLNEEPRLPPLHWMTALSSALSDLWRRLGRMVMSLKTRFRRSN
jgi:capsular exopolysaccharide synthesis family protein